VDLKGNRMGSIPDEFFARMVADDVKNRASIQQRSTLLEPDNWDRWKRALLALVQNLEEQIESIVLDAEADSVRYGAMGRQGKRLADEAERAYGSKKTRVERFKFHVDRRLDQVASMVDSGEPIDENPWETVDFYRRAISTHRNMLHDFDLEDTAVDRALWATLDNKWEFDRVDSLSL